MGRLGGRGPNFVELGLIHVNGERGEEDEEDEDDGGVFCWGEPALLLDFRQDLGQFVAPENREGKAEQAGDEDDPWG